MITNIKLKKANAYRLSQEKLRNKALSKGVNLIAPETIFLSNDTIFGKNVTIEPYVVIGQKVKIVDNSYIKSLKHTSVLSVIEPYLCSANYASSSLLLIYFHIVEKLLIQIFSVQAN